MQQLLLDVAPIAGPSLETFLGAGHAQVVHHLRTLQSSGVVYVWGAQGTGKSHLLRGALQAFQEQHPRAVTAFVSPATPATELNHYAQLPQLSWIGCDDVNRYHPRQLQSLFHLLRRVREQPGICVVASGPCPPGQLLLRADVRTRLASELVFGLEPLNDEETLIMLSNTALRRGYRLAPEVARYMITHLERDPRSLLGWIDALDTYGLERQRAITLPLLRELMQSRAAPMTSRGAS